MYKNVDRKLWMDVGFILGTTAMGCVVETIGNYAGHKIGFQPKLALLFLTVSAATYRIFQTLSDRLVSKKTWINNSTIKAPSVMVGLVVSAVSFGITSSNAKNLTFLLTAFICYTFVRRKFKSDEKKIDVPLLPEDVPLIPENDQNFDHSLQPDEIEKRKETLEKLELKRDKAIKFYQAMGFATKRLENILLLFKVINNDVKVPKSAKLKIDVQPLFDQSFETINKTFFRQLSWALEGLEMLSKNYERLVEAVKEKSEEKTVSEIISLNNKMLKLCVESDQEMGEACDAVGAYKKEYNL